MGEGGKSLGLRLEVNLLSYGAESEEQNSSQHMQSLVLNKEKVTHGMPWASPCGEKEAEGREP